MEVVGEGMVATVANVSSSHLLYSSLSLSFLFFSLEFPLSFSILLSLSFSDFTSSHWASLCYLELAGEAGLAQF